MANAEVKLRRAWCRVAPSPTAVMLASALEHMRASDAAGKRCE
jgi:hypothetical protein